MTDTIAELRELLAKAKDACHCLSIPGDPAYPIEQDRKLSTQKALQHAAVAALPALLDRVEAGEAETIALRSALRALLDACLHADNRENLSEEIDGSLLDAASEALELQYPVIWTEHQVAMLRGRQADGSMHPYTCGGDRADAAHLFCAEEEGEEAGLLYPTVRGWKCPACDYRQFWSHETGDRTHPRQQGAGA